MKSKPKQESFQNLRIRILHESIKSANALEKALGERITNFDETLPGKVSLVKLFQKLACEGFTLRRCPSGADKKLKLFEMLSLENQTPYTPTFK